MRKLLRLIKLLSLNKYLKVSKLIAYLLLFKSTIGQNLIRNGSFENYNIPINWNLWGGDFIGYYASPPDTIMIDWGGYQTPDYCVVACPHNYASVPVNHVGFNYSKEGNAYVGLGPYQRDSEVKEYIYQHLNQPLQAGKVYCLSFYVNRSERTEYAIKQIGAYFSSSLPSTVGNMYINANPQVVNNVFVVDTVQWIEIQGCFTANGGEQYITIGNFNSNSNTDTLNIGTNNPVAGWLPSSYYYIDDITLIDQTTVGLQNISFLNEVVGVSPNPANDLLKFTFSTEKQGRKLELYDTIGNLIITKEADSNNLSLTTENLPNGIYFYSILVGEKTIKTDKIVIIK